MTVVKPHLSSLFWIWHPGLKFVVLPAAKGHCCEVLNSWLPKAIAKGWGAALLLFLGCWMLTFITLIQTTLLPQQGCAGVTGPSLGIGPKMSIFGTKIGGWRVYGACSSLSAVASLELALSQAEQIHGQVPAAFTESANSHFSSPKHPSLKFD